MSMMPEKPPLNITYDERRDIVTIAGQPFSGDFFRQFGLTSSEGRIVFTLFRDQRGVVRIERVCTHHLHDVMGFLDIATGGWRGDRDRKVDDRGPV